MSSNAELLAYPSRDYLDKCEVKRPVNALPKRQFPAWSRLPLTSKIPATWSTHDPVLLTRTKLGEQLFRHFPGKEFDDGDPLNVSLPAEGTQNLHDPHLKDFFNKRDKRRHLLRNKLIDEDGAVACSLADFNRYRAYLRRIMAQEENHRRKVEEELASRKKEDREHKILADRKRFWSRLAGMHRLIKPFWADLRQKSMHDQRCRDMKVINKEMEKCQRIREREQKFEEKFQPIFQRHIQVKYKTDHHRRLQKIAILEKDLQRLQGLIERQKTKELERQVELDRFWDRKMATERAWLEREEELLAERKEAADDRIRFMDLKHRHPDAPLTPLLVDDVEREEPEKRKSYITQAKITLSRFHSRRGSLPAISEDDSDSESESRASEGAPSEAKARETGSDPVGEPREDEDDPNEAEAHPNSAEADESKEYDSDSELDSRETEGGPKKAEDNPNSAEAGKPKESYSEDEYF